MDAEEPQPFWTCRGFNFRRYRSHVILDGAGVPPVLDTRMARLLASHLNRVADEIDAEQDTAC